VVDDSGEKLGPRADPFSGVDTAIGTGIGAGLAKVGAGPWLELPFGIVGTIGNGTGLGIGATFWTGVLVVSGESGADTITVGLAKACSGAATTGSCGGDVALANCGG